MRAGFIQEEFLGGAEVLACDIPFEELKKGLKLVVSEGTYWEEPVKLAGLVEKIEGDGESKTILLNLLGTTSESLVRWKGKFPGHCLSVHLCHKDCGKIAKDGLVHCERLKVAKAEAEEPWMLNLSGMDPRPKEDELEMLRTRAEKVGTGEGAPGEGKSKSESSGSEVSSKEKKSRKKKKKKKKNHKASKEKKKVNGAKALTEVFGTTGLDPDPDVRRKALKRAKKIAKKKGRRSSSSTSSRSSEESSLTGEGGSSEIFGQEVRVKSIWLRIPGALTAATLQQLQASLVQQSGQPWELDKKSLPPIFTQYWKAVLDGKSTRPMSREMHTLGFIRGSSFAGSSSSGMRCGHTEAEGFGASGWRRGFPGGSTAGASSVGSPKHVFSHRDFRSFEAPERRCKSKGSSFRKRILGPQQIKRRLRLLGKRQEQEGRVCKGQRKKDRRGDGKKGEGKSGQDEREKK